MNLTQMSKFFKLSLKVLLVFGFFYYLYILYIGPKSRMFIKKLFPRKEPINPSYGILPPLEFVEKPINGNTPQYVLNTKNGQLPDKIPGRMLVYRTKPPQFSYLEGTNAIKDSATLGFYESDLLTDLKGDEFKWKSLTSDGSLSIKLQSRELHLNTDISSSSDKFASGTLTDTAATITMFPS